MAEWLRPSIPSSVIADQYAFKPSGSIEAALISMMRSATYMLETNQSNQSLFQDKGLVFHSMC